MKRRYGFFGGSFNPVTGAHINLASKILSEYRLDKVIFVPMGNSYQKQDLIDEKHRYHMLDIAISGYERLEVSDIELGLPNQITMLQAFEKIQEEYKDSENYFIIGSDNLDKLIKLQDLEILAKNYHYIVIEREKYTTRSKISLNPILVRFKTHFNLLEDNPYEQISSTEVRNLLKDNHEEKILKMIPKEVYEYIKENELYICEKD